MILSPLNLPIEAKFHKKSCDRIPCSCSAKIEAEKIHKLWRSLEMWVFNFLKNYLTASNICRPERTAFIVFLEKSKVWVHLILMKAYRQLFAWSPFHNNISRIDLTCHNSSPADFSAHPIVLPPKKIIRFCHFFKVNFTKRKNYQLGIT